MHWIDLVLWATPSSGTWGSNRQLAQNTGPCVLATHHPLVTKNGEEQKFGTAASLVYLENSYSGFKVQISLPLDLCLFFPPSNFP